MFRTHSRSSSSSYSVSTSNTESFTGKRRVQDSDRSPSPVKRSKYEDSHQSKLVATFLELQELNDKSIFALIKKGHCWQFLTDNYVSLDSKKFEIVLAEENGEPCRQALGDIICSLLKEADKREGQSSQIVSSPLFLQLVQKYLTVLLASLEFRFFKPEYHLRCLASLFYDLRILPDYIDNNPEAKTTISQMFQLVAAVLEHCEPSNKEVPVSLANSLLALRDYSRDYPDILKVISPQEIFSLFHELAHNRYATAIHQEKALKALEELINIQSSLIELIHPRDIKEISLNFAESAYNFSNRALAENLYCFARFGIMRYELIKKMPPRTIRKMLKSFLSNKRSITSLDSERILRAFSIFLKIQPTLLDEVAPIDIARLFESIANSRNLTSKERARALLNLSDLAIEDPFFLKEVQPLDLSRVFHQLVRHDKATFQEKSIALQALAKIAREGDNDALLNAINPDDVDIIFNVTVDDEAKSIAFILDSIASLAPQHMHLLKSLNASKLNKLFVAIVNNNPSRQSRDSCYALWSLGRLPESQAPLLEHIDASHIVKLFKEAAYSTTLGNKKKINALWSLGKLSTFYPDLLNDIKAEYIHHLLSELLKDEEYNKNSYSSVRSKTLWALSKIAATHPSLLDTIAEEEIITLLSIVMENQNILPEEITDALKLVACLLECKPSLLNTLEASHVAILFNLLTGNKKANAQDKSLSLHSLTKIGEIRPKLLMAIKSFDIQERFDGVLKASKKITQNLSVTLWSLGILSTIRTSLLNDLCPENIQQMVAQIADDSDKEPVNIANTLKAIGLLSEARPQLTMQIKENDLAILFNQVMKDKKENPASPEQKASGLRGLSRIIYMRLGAMQAMAAPILTCSFLKESLIILQAPHAQTDKEKIAVLDGLMYLILELKSLNLLDEFINSDFNDLIAEAVQELSARSDQLTSKCYYNLQKIREFFRVILKKEWIPMHAQTAPNKPESTAYHLKVAEIFRAEEIENEAAVESGLYIDIWFKEARIALEIHGAIHYMKDLAGNNVVKYTENLRKFLFKEAHDVQFILELNNIEISRLDFNKREDRLQLLTSLSQQTEDPSKVFDILSSALKPEFTITLAKSENKPYFPSSSSYFSLSTETSTSNQEASSFGKMS